MKDTPPWEDPRRVLGRHHLKPKRGYSQNFLVARPIVERIADAVARRASTGQVVELGPGVGTLTGALLRNELRVRAIEADPDMRQVLSDPALADPALSVVAGDAAALDLPALRAELGAFVLAGNLPYAVTGAILRHVTEAPHSVEAAVFMVQREVRDRLLAKPGEKAYGALTVFAQAVFQVDPVCRVSAGCFHPAPKVESAVVAMTPLVEARATVDGRFARAVRAAFEMRRKMLRNALQSTAQADEVDHALTQTGIDGRRRGETLSVEEFAALARCLPDLVDYPRAL